MYIIKVNYYTGIVTVWLLQVNMMCFNTVEAEFVVMAEFDANLIGQSVRLLRRHTGLNSRC